MILCNKFLLSKDKNQSQYFPRILNILTIAYLVILSSLSGSVSNPAKTRTYFSEFTENKADIRTNVFRFLWLYL